MRITLRRILGTGLFASLAIAAGCQHLPAGPSLSNLVVTDLTWRPTAGDANLCCCRIAGLAKNNNQITVDVSIKFSGYNSRQAAPVATTMYFVKELGPSATRTIDAAGFIVPCASIASLKYEVEVKGLATPN